VKGSFREVAEAIGMQNQKQEEIALIVARLVIWLEIVRQHRSVLYVEKWNTLLGILSWH